MKRIYTYLVLCLVVLTACDPENNWFIHTVTYNAKVDKSELVVASLLEAGKKPVVFVGESVFFLDTASNCATKYLQDAVVTMQVNGDEKITMKGGFYLSPQHITRYGYSCNYVLQPGDKVSFVVTHPNYETPAKVSQQIPYPAVCKFDFSGVTKTDNASALANLNVHLSPMATDPTTMLCFIAQAFGHTEQTQLSYKTGHDTTLYWDFGCQPWVYSQDLSFAGYDETNVSLSGGYYGAERFGLFRAISTKDEDVRLSVYYNNYDREAEYDGVATKSYLDSVVVNVSTVTRDYYLYHASMMAAGFCNFWVQDVFSGSNGGDIFGDIGDMFDEMGSMEGIQVYSNVENAIGHVTASTSTKYTVVADRTEE